MTMKGALKKIGEEHESGKYVPLLLCCCFAVELVLDFSQRPWQRTKIQCLGNCKGCITKECD